VTGHEQLTACVVTAVAAGDLVPGERLPTVRGLAESLGLAPNTVARSYRDLERSGVIETRGRSGSFVAYPDRSHALRALATRFVAQARDMGADRESALAAVAHAWPAGQSAGADSSDVVIRDRTSSM